MERQGTPPLGDGSARPAPHAEGGSSEECGGELHCVPVAITRVGLDAAIALCTQADEDGRDSTATLLRCKHVRLHVSVASGQSRAVSYCLREY